MTNITCDESVLFSEQALLNWQEFNPYNLKCQSCLKPIFHQTFQEVLAHYLALFIST